MKRTFLLFALLALLISACGGASPTPPAAPAMSQSPRAWIDSPLDGATLPLGEVEILSHAASLGGIAQVELSVDGAVIRTDPNPSPGETLNLARQTWLPRAGGTYQVSVRAQNTGGEWSAPASITLTILDATPTETPSPMPTVAPSETPTPSPTAMPAGPPVIILVRNSFCRTGPGMVYREITALAAGDSAEVRGISQDGFWLFVYWTKFNVECWIVASAAPADTNLSGVPVLAAPPTPAPTSPPPTSIPPTATSFKP
jgi:hypothetical protein